ncbi:MAG: hypothetical protein WDZ70_02510 [Candidatus Paceibacterota bacterium]
MKLGTIFSILIKGILLIPFFLFFLLFAGCSFVMKKTDDMDMRGRTFIRGVFGSCAAVSMVFVGLLGKVYE